MHVIATAGHVDHGKSTLVRALTGMEPDRWAEVRRRGMTIDLGFAWTELPGGQTVAFVDVPGHERFVGAMLAGVGPVPAVMFVVAADEGWMPQSAEHLDALAALGTRHGLLVITRSDLMEPELALEEAQRHLAASALGELPAVSVSGATGAGMGELRGALAELVAGLPPADPDADVRLWVDRAFTIRGAGTVLTGTLPGGRIAVDDELLLEPGGRRVSVRGLQALGQPVDQVTGVARVAVNLRGLPRESVGRGDVLVTPGRWLTTSVLDVRLHPVRPDTGAGQDADPAKELPQQLHLHIGAAAVPVRVRPLGSDPTDGATVRLTLSSPLPLRIGDRALLLDRERATALSARLVAAVAEHDAADPLDPGLPLGAARRVLELPDAKLVDVLLRQPPSAGQLVARDGRVHRAGPGDALPAGVRRAMDAVRVELTASPFAAPDAGRLAELGLGPRELAGLVRAGELVKVADGVYLLPGAERAAVEVLATLGEPEFTLSAARQALGTSRRVAVPLLERLARLGLTRRTEDGRHRVARD